MINTDKFSYDSLPRKVQKEISALIERRNNLIMALENEIDNLNKQKSFIISDAGAKAYSNYLTNNDYAEGLLAFWKDIDLIENSKKLKYDKIDEIIKRYDEDINIIYNNALQTSDIDHQTIASEQNSVCNICGKPYIKGEDNFCSNCGNKLSADSVSIKKEYANANTYVTKSIVCPKCQNIVDPSSVFCIYCGTKIN